MGKKSRKHTHKYHRIALGYQNVWACALPDCSHFMPKQLEEMVVGKYSLCWECGNEFILNPENMVSDKPICENCKLGTDKPELHELLDKL